MREILFRGLMVDTGYWVYGDLIHDGKIFILRNGNRHHVTPKTVASTLVLRTKRTKRK